jgi:5-methylcytosine-specific restriction endonuclease McrA
MVPKLSKRRRKKSTAKPTVAELKKRLNRVSLLLAKRRDGSRCVLCGNPANHAHHFFPKGSHGSVRWEPDNLVMLCYGCHIGKIHRGGDTEELRDRLIKRIGTKAFEDLKWKAHVPIRQDRIYLEDLLKELEDALRSQDNG